MEDTKPGPRWWVRFPRRLSVRTLMLLVLIVGGGLGWVVHRARVQREAVGAIERAGGQVYYEWGWKDGYAPLGAHSRWPAWLLNALGPDCFDSVTAVIFHPSLNADDALLVEVGRLRRLEYLDLGGSRSVTDAGLVHLRSLAALKHLDLSFTEATGAGLAQLRRLSRLEELILPTRRVTDDDLAHLRELTALRVLDLAMGSEVSDAGLVHLEGLVNLRELTIATHPGLSPERPRVTSAGLRSLRGLARLEVLGLSGSRVGDLAPIGHLSGLKVLDLPGSPLDDAGLAPVEGLTRLTRLDLSDTKVTDAGLASIAGLTNLEDLSLGATAVGDEGLVRLAGLVRLRRLALWWTRITDAGLARLGSLKSCDRIGVGGTAVTDAGIQALQRVLPRAIFDRREF